MYVPATPARAVLTDAPLARFEIAGGTPSAGGAAQLFVPPAETVTVTHTSLSLHRRELNVLTGDAAVVSGKLRGNRRAANLSGRRLQLQARRPRGWSTIASTHTGPGGHFRLRYVPRHIGSELLRVRFSGDSYDRRATRLVGRMNVYRLAEASWYGGGGGLACGGELTSATMGVANKTLPCGTSVTLRYDGRSVTVRVIDRGPYVAGREFDLTEATKLALGFGDTGPVWSTR